MEHNRVFPVAKQIYSWLKPACQKITLCGSLRREKSEVSDLDIVCLPQFDPDLYGEEGTEFSALESALNRAVKAGLLALRPGVINGGDRLRRYLVPVLDNLPCEIYLTNAENHGYIVAIRTGSADFAKAMVTPRTQTCQLASGNYVTGYLPTNMACIGGYLYQYEASRKAQDARKAEKPMFGQRLACPNEAAFFRHLGLEVPPPSERNEAGLKKLVRLEEAS